MTWFDELDEPTQRQWRSRLEKGRLDLSASVEQTLAEGTADEDGEEEGAQVVDAPGGEARRGATVIPPRLSLQTKPMYAVAPASQPLPVPAPAIEEEAAQEYSQEKQSTGIFSRLAQRITMSLTAITLPFQAQAPVPETPAREMHVPMPGMQPPTNLSMQTVTTTVRVERSETTTTIIEASALHRSLPPAGLAPVPQVPQLPRPDPTVQGEGKARPAGYPTKVHLEAAPKGISQHGTTSVSGKDAEGSYPAHDSTEPLSLRNTLSVSRSVPTLELPTVNTTSTIEATQSSVKSAPGDEAMYDLDTSGRLPSVHVPEKGSNEGPSLSPSWAIFGSGSFEANQGDIAVACPSIVGASVVTVMLASDPGPVVVQYISLLPGTGFTVHLSAPTKVKTQFNYVVMQPQGKS